MDAPVNAYRYWLDAKAYSAVMRFAFGPKGIVPAHGFVAYNLAAHAIELLLKGFLFGKGLDRAQLRGIGHDLEAALDAAKARGLQTLIGAETPLDDVVRYLSPLHKRRAFSYPGEVRNATTPASDMVTLPQPRVVVTVVETLLSALASHCHPPSA